MLGTITKTVYRVENEIGLGPYNSGSSYRHRFPDNDENHPGLNPWGWHVDAVLLKKVIDPDPYRFGFSTMKQFNDWFDEPRRKVLRTAGYHLAVYHADTRICSRKQCVFANAVKVDRIPL